MGIQIISAGAAATANAFNAMPDAMAGNGGIDFAGLLAMQLQPQLGNALAATEKTTDTKKDDTAANADTGLAATDPALAWLTAANVPVTNTATPGDKPKDEDALLGKGLALSKDKLGEQAADAAKSEAVRNNDKTPAVQAASTQTASDKPFGDMVAAAAKAQNGKADDAGPAIVADTTPDASPTGNVVPGQGVHQHANVQAQNTANTTVTAPLHDQRWATDFGQKVVWMAKADQQNAQISINPPQLGPIQININMSGDSATAVFASPHAEVRQALETAMPRLREMMADAGINLAQTDVGSQFLQQQSAQERQQQPTESPRFAVDTAILSGQSAITGQGSTVVPSGRGEGLVDLFA